MTLWNYLLTFQVGISMVNSETNGGFTQNGTTRMPYESKKINHSKKNLKTTFRVIKQIQDSIPLKHNPIFSLERPPKYKYTKNTIMITAFEKSKAQ